MRLEFFHMMSKTVRPPVQSITWKLILFLEKEHYFKPGERVINTILSVFRGQFLQERYILDLDVWK